MPRFKPKGVLERSAAGDLWKNTLSRIPSIFGRLVYLSSLRDLNSGIYRHHGLSALFGREESSRALRESHQAVFQEWLNLPLREQYEDLKGYLAGQEDPAPLIVANWIKTGSYRALLPAIAKVVEIELFSSDLKALLEILTNELGAEGTSPSSSPPR